MRADAVPECRTWLRADADERFCVLLTCEPRQALRPVSPEHSDYEETLDRLLERLRDTQAVVEYAVARAVRGPQGRQGANNLKNGPIHLATASSISGLRREILTLRDLAEHPLPKQRGRDVEPIREHVELYISLAGYDSSGLDVLLEKLRVPLRREVDRTVGLKGDVAGEDHVESEVYAGELHFPDPFQGVLERKAWTRVRREQTALRKLLAGNHEYSNCALCGLRYPVELLVAAHIKKRSLCGEAERRDLANVAMLACALGCDSLYEAGWITVDVNGSVRTVGPAMVESDPLSRHLLMLEGKRCRAHTADSEQYFAWHRDTIFRGVLRHWADPVKSV